jgi:hypothetical protein
LIRKNALWAFDLFLFLCLRGVGSLVMAEFVGGLYCIGLSSRGVGSLVLKKEHIHISFTNHQFA